MTESMRIDNIELWHDLVCAHILHGECSQMAPGFHVDLSANQTPDVGLFHINSVPHLFEQTEKHLRDSDEHNFLVVLQLRGNGSHVQDGREIFVGPGDLTCCDCSRPLHLSFYNEFERLVLTIPRQIIVSALGPTERFTAIDLGKNNAVSRVLATFLRDMDATLGKVSPQIAVQLSQAVMPLVITTIAEQFHIKLDDSSLQRRSLLFRAEEYIKAHSRNPGLNTQAVADALGISTRHLQDVFQLMSQRPSDYIWACRLRNSRQDFTNPLLAALSIREIARRCGFVDVSHFSRRFKEAFGNSPSVFRESIQTPTNRLGDRGSFLN
jgi:AraC family transcriptional activator of tynA and feaB